MSATAIRSIALIREAAFEVYRRRRVLYPAIIFPIVSLLALDFLSLAFYVTTPMSMVMLGLAGIPFYVVLATTCHRVILIGDDSLPNKFGLFWSEQETRFLGQLVILGLITTAITLPIWALALVLPSSTFDVEAFRLLIYGVIIVTAYFDGRFSLILPATAIGERISLGKSWEMSKGMGWRIAVALLIPYFGLKLIEYILFDLLVETDSPSIGFLWGLTTFPLSAFFIAIITVAYRQLLTRADGQ